MSRAGRSQVRADELAYARQVANRNAKFLRASPERQRVMLAQDVLNGLDSGEYVAKSGTYLMFHDIDDTGNVTERCVGCALGLTFAAFFGATGGGGLSQHVPVHAMRHMLGDVFSEDQLHLMECAFEGWDRRMGSHGTVETWQFNRDDDGERIADDAECLRRVMRNVIRNRGTFVPADKEPLP